MNFLCVVFIGGGCRSKWCARTVSRVAIYRLCV